MATQNENEHWLMPRFARTHWIIVLVFGILASFSSPGFSIAGFLGSLVGALLLVWVGLIVYNLAR